MYTDTNHNTPIHSLSLQLNENKFYIKRDDLLPVSFGGNKARKAILFFNDIENKNAGCIVTYGSSSSNHCRIIANIAVAKNMPCYIISPSETNVTTTNSKIIGVLNAVVIECPIDEVSQTIELQLSALKENGLRPYFIPGGGHGNIGTQSYVDAFKEILNYEASKGEFFDYIFHPSGTGTTQAGLICGNLLNACERKIIGISIARKMPYGSRVVLDSANSYLKSIDENPIENEKIDFVDDYILNGYGAYNKDILKTIKEVLILDGVPMDPTYTGKAFWGMKEFIINNEIKNKKILFIHTGGTPLFFDGLEELMND
ncbi:1-aminocyclopropane-1-carboxylate deaminase/D-cysteine desulfhydrase [Planococcus ruber]|uniref:1-aminocyclopropane-1-carboxylate deaminase/D-cysteine desulfhydrase n=1 Tax=Planococcus ruber TaxID=2027871 RepID=UPI001FF0124E|nr:pyridoxal-phosphate dependent enzyme [Planococcus ruber]MCJ1908274.1 pyridoxal-phosphate dependent enzyme [Planococcus ruber]